MLKVLMLPDEALRFEAVAFAIRLEQVYFGVEPAELRQSRNWSPFARRYSAASRTASEYGPRTGPFPATVVRRNTRR